jgi:predicted ATPase/class 3 adenylate cyclase
MRYHFANCVLDTDQHTLRRAGQLVRLRPKAFQVLIYLLLHHDRVVTKQELAEQFWPDQFITDAVVENTLRAARQAMGDSGQTQTIIQTLRGVGYRVVALVTMESETPAVDQPQERFEHATEQEPDSSGEASLIRLHGSAAERRQLTVLFCEIVDPTTLSSRMALEDYLDVIRSYQNTCTAVIRNLESHLVRHRGEGVIAYFGYPMAHEDDAHRAIRAGLALIDALKPLSHRLEQEAGVRLEVRVGIHTGLVIMGEIGDEERQESLAIGETPNLAHRLQRLAEPDTIVISAATSRLVQGYFTLDELRGEARQGIATDEMIFRVIAPTGVQHRLDVVVSGSLTPMVNRKAELSFFLERWEQAQEGRGQVIVLNGEAGIGKSRLALAMRELLDEVPYIRLECRCSPYYQNSAWYPVIELSHRLLRWQDHETSRTRLRKLKTALSQLTLPLEKSLPLMASLLGVPLDDFSAPPLPQSPQRQREQTLEMILEITLALASQQPVFLLVEDLHWADPSTLELIELLVAQVPTSRLCLICSCRPSYAVTWRHWSYCFEINLGRLSQRHVEAMVVGITRGKQLTADVLQQVDEKTNGVPLFVEELTKMLLETESLRDIEDQYHLVTPLSDMAVPATLYDSLMARLDRLQAAKSVAQLAAILGRQFSYELLRAVSPWEEGMLQQGLRQLVDAELVFQRGLSVQVTYIFKHSLVQDMAYHSLVRNTRQHYHQRTAEVLVDQFPAQVEAEPERLAYHFTEAGLTEQAFPYWYQAGLRAFERSAYVEASRHLTMGLELLATLPDTPERAQQELRFQSVLGPIFIGTKGWAAPETGEVYTRARALCQQIGQSPQLFPALWGLYGYDSVRGDYQAARELAQQILDLAESQNNTGFIVQACFAMGLILFLFGELSVAQTYVARGHAIYDHQQHNPYSFLYGNNPGVSCLCFDALTLWHLGYPEQALARSQAAVALAEQTLHPFSVVFALDRAAAFHQFRRDVAGVQQWAGASIRLASEQGFPMWVAAGTILQGWSLAEQGDIENGLTQIHEGLNGYRVTGAEMFRPHFLAVLAETYGKGGQPEEGLQVVAEALDLAYEIGEHFYEAELYRLKGELLVNDAWGASLPHCAKALACFQHAIEIAQKQSEKSLELRASISLARLWQIQGKRQEAYDLLTLIYDWFTEGFDTADLIDAKTLLDELV